LAKKSGAYKFEKRRKELAKQKKKKEKLERRQGRDNENEEPVPGDPP
jgi:hypothetical protein